MARSHGRGKSMYESIPDIFNSQSSMDDTDDKTVKLLNSDLNKFKQLHYSNFGAKSPFEGICPILGGNSKKQGS